MIITICSPEIDWTLFDSQTLQRGFGQSRNYLVTSAYTGCKFTVTFFPLPNVSKKPRILAWIPYLIKYTLYSPNAHLSMFILTFLTSYGIFLVISISLQGFELWHIFLNRKVAITARKKKKALKQEGSIKYFIRISLT